MPGMVILKGRQKKPVAQPAPERLYRCEACGVEEKKEFGRSLAPVYERTGYVCNCGNGGTMRAVNEGTEDGG